MEDQKTEQAENNVPLKKPRTKKTDDMKQQTGGGTTFSETADRIITVKRLTPEQEKMLMEPLPPEAVKPHPSKDYLSTIKAIYVVERFNEVFGIGGWKQRVEHINTTGKMVVVKMIFEAPEYGIYLESYGGNDNADLGDAYKGASTDALTKIGSFLGVGMDVFKGKSQGVKSAPVDNRAWMTDQIFEATKAAMEAAIADPTNIKLRSAKDTFEAADKAMRISKDHKQVLQSLLNPTK